MDDSFAKGWTLISGYSFESDGDVASLVADASVDCIIEKTFPASLSSDVYTRLQARITDVDATTDVLLYNESLAAWDLVLTATTPGLVEVSLLAGKVYTKIRLKIPTISYADIDYVAICKNSMLIPDMGDLVEELRITRPLLNSAIAGAKLSIPNFGGTAPGGFCDITINVMKDGNHYDGAAVRIGTESYNDGQVAHLPPGTISLGVNIPDDLFESWTVLDDNITVDMPGEQDTYLNVLGTGPDTLILTLQDTP